MSDFTQAVYSIRDNVMALKAKQDVKGNENKISRQPCLRASGFWSCDRNLYYQVAAWQERPLISAEKRCLFDEGYWMEVATLRDLENAGYDIERQQIDYTLPVRNGIITGHLDGYISGYGITEPVPLEVKGYAFGADQYETWRDMQAAKQPWIQAVPNQLMLYLLQANAERGVLVLRDKKSGQVYPIAVELDYELAESLLHRAEEVYDCLEMQEPPKRAPYDSNLCGACDWEHICQPLAAVPVSTRGRVFNEPMEAQAEEYFITLAAGKRNKELAEELKDFAKGIAAAHGLTEIFLGEVAVLEVNEYETRTVVKIKPQEETDE